MKNFVLKKSDKQLLAILMTLVMLFGLLPVSALAATEVETLSQEAVDGAAGGRIVLAASDETQNIGAITISKDLVIVLNGNTLKGSFDISEGKTLTIRGKGALQSEDSLFTGQGAVVVDLDGKVTAPKITKETLVDEAGYFVSITLKRGEFQGTLALPATKTVEDCIAPGSEITASGENTFTVADITAPIITAGNATRSSDAEASIIFEASEDGTYSYSVANENGQEVIAKTADSPMVVGTNTISITGLPAGLVKLTLMTKDTSGNATVPNVTKDIPAYVPPEYTVTKPEGEGFAFEGADKVTHGEDYAFTIKAKYGYKDLKVTVNGAEVTLTDDAYTIAAVDKAPVITAEVSPIAYGIAAEGEGFTLDPATTSVEYNQSYTFEVKPAEGYEIGADGLIVQVKGSDTALEADENGKYTIPGIQADTVVVVSGMVKKTYTITLPTGDGFTVTADSGSNTVEHGEDFAFTVTVDSGNGYVQSPTFAVKVGDTALTGNNGKYSISDVTENKTVSVSGVSLSSFEIWVTKPDGCSITAVAGSNPAPYDSSYQFMVNLSTGYKKTDDFAVTVNGTPLTADSAGIYSINNIRATTNIVITGVAVSASAYNITFSSDASYTVTPVNSSSPVAPGGSYKFKVEPKPGYVRGSSFAVKLDGKAMSPDTNGEYLINNIQQDHNVSITGVVSASTAVTYSVTLSGGTGFSYSAQNGSVSPVAPGGSYSFKVNLANGYTKGNGFAVKANGNVIQANTNGVYTISGISANQTVTVTGVVKAATGGGGTTVAAAPAVTTATLPNGAMGAAYNQTLKANGQNITWSYTGSLPNGLTLNTTTGVISGTPTLNGTFRFAVKATNNAGSNTKQLTITVTGEEYKISDGQKAEWTQGGEEGVLFKTDSKAQFIKVQVDGKDVAARYVETAENGASVTLKPEYLEDLDNGAHTLTIVYADGSARTTFTVAAEDKSEPPTIAMQPESQTANSGDKISFTIMANGTTPLICQWQVDKNDGNGWQNITGAVNASYTVTADTIHNGYKFRCTVTNGAGSVTSDEAVLTVAGAEAPAEDAEDTPDAPDAAKKKSSTWLWVTVAGVAVAGIAAAGIIVFRNRKYYKD